MGVIKTRYGYTFEKSPFKSPDTIRELYRKKLSYPISKQGKELPKWVRESYITNDEFGGYLRLERASQFDPRYHNVYFKTREAAEKALLLAEKLDCMSENEFLESGFPYRLEDYIGLTNVILDEGKISRTKRWRELIDRLGWSKVVIFIVLLGLITTIFYWLQIRPSNIRKDCANQAMKEYGGRSSRNNYYRLCLTKSGLKPESLFVGD